MNAQAERISKHSKALFISMIHNPSNHLLACCRIIAQKAGHSPKKQIIPKDFEVGPEVSAKETLEKIITAARIRGFRTVIHHSPRNIAPDRMPGLVSGMASVMPVIVEMRNHHYWIADAIQTEPDTGASIICVTIPQFPGKAETCEMDIQTFATKWTGGALIFESVNTALVCFSILAREHKIELTQERLIHEYALDEEEISKPHC